MAPGGRIAIMGPNYRYCAREYWDCADHYVALTHVAIAEHLYAAGFEPSSVISALPALLLPRPAAAVAGADAAYLRMPLAWELLGKQFLRDRAPLTAALRAGGGVGPAYGGRRSGRSSESARGPLIGTKRMKR